jgi:hypothetical protein
LNFTEEEKDNERRVSVLLETWMISNLSQESSITVFVKTVNKLSCHILASDGKMAANPVHATVNSPKKIKSGAVSVTVIVNAVL